MWRRIIVAGLLAAAAILPSAVASAATPASSTDVAMKGQGSVVGSQSSPQLRLKFNAADGSNWLLEIAVNPLQNSSQAANLGGTFILGFGSNPLIRGTASGVLNSNGTGDIKLTDGGGTSLDVTFTIKTADNIAADVKGQWPSITVTPLGTVATPVQPANHFFWYLSRTAGLVAYLLFFTSICFGLLMMSKQSGRVMAKWQSLELHQFLALSGICFLLLHIFSLLGDHYFNFTIGQLLFPVNLPYRPVSVTIGIVVFWAAVVILLAFQSRKIIGRKVWRLLHPAATALFFAALIHGILAGTDTSMPWTQWMYILTAGVAVFALITQLSKYLATKTSVPSPKAKSYEIARRKPRLS